MDFSNFDFNSLDDAALQATFDELDALLPMEPPLLPLESNAFMPLFTPDDPSDFPQWALTGYTGLSGDQDADALHQLDELRSPNDNDAWDSCPQMPAFANLTQDQTHGALGMRSHEIFSSGGSLRQGSSPYYGLPISQNAPSQLATVSRPDDRARKCDLQDCLSLPAEVWSKSMKDHILEANAAHILRQWPGDCIWPKCVSKSIFKTAKSLETHVYNIHISPLVCKNQNCTQTKPFGKQYDLDRHVQTVHSPKRLYCPHKDCLFSNGETSNGFSRKDKLRRHLKERHGEFECGRFADCSRGQGNGYETEDQRMLHYDYYHGPFECVLYDCSTAKKRGFSKDRMAEHLLSHGVPRGIGERILNSVSRTLDHTIRVTHLNQYGLRSFRCGIGPCQDQTSSSYDPVDLVRHLRPDENDEGHKFSIDTSLEILRGAENDPDHVARQSHIPITTYCCRYQGCKSIRLKPCGVEEIVTHFIEFHQMAPGFASSIADCHSASHGD